MYTTTDPKQLPPTMTGARLFIHEVDGKPRFAILHEAGDVEYIEVSERAMTALRGIPVP